MSKSFVEMAYDCLSRAQSPVHVADLCERIGAEFPSPPTPATLHVLLRLDPRFESHDHYRWCLAPPSENTPTLSQIADRIIHYLHSQGKRFLSEEVLASLLADDYNLSPVESLRLVREASTAYMTRIPQAGVNIFLALEDSTSEVG